MNFRILPFLAMLLFSFGLQAQQSLPRGFAAGEEEAMRAYIQNIAERQMACESLPADANFRTPAEWEELESLVITWTQFPSILREIVRAAQPEVNVIIITTNPTSVENYLSSGGIDPSFNIQFIDRNFDSVWMRDYGPNVVYADGVGQRSIVDWIYNRPRPNDDTVPEAVADAIEVPLYCTTLAPEDMVHTGGNFMSDGLGRGFSSDLFIEENGPQNEWGTSNHSEEDIDDIMYRYMGIDSYPKMEALPFDVIHHIDMHMKLLDEETLLVGQYPEGVADGPQIEANIQFILDNFKAPSQEPYKIVRIPMPPDAGGDYPDYPGNSWWLAGDYRTYANAVFVNKTIIVPTYEEQYDTTGLRIWEETMPGYTIVGVNAEQMISSLGAIHCITKEVGVAEPLVVNHLTPRFFCYEDNVMRFEASADHISGIAQMNFYFREAGSLDYVSNEMMFDEANDIYFNELAFISNGEGEIEYYFEATANDGKVINRPMPAPQAYFSVPYGSCVPSSIQPVSEIISAKVFPNPASAITFFELELAEGMQGQINLQNILGQRVINIHQGTLPAGSQKYFFDASQLDAGVYFIELSGAGVERFSEKLIVQ